MSQSEQHLPTSAKYLQDCQRAWKAEDRALAMTHATAALSAARDGCSASDELDALLAIAGLSSEVDDVEGVVRALERAQPIAARVGDRARTFKVFNLLGNALGGIGDFERSFAFHRMALDVAFQAGDRLLENVARSNTAARWLDVAEDLVGRGEQERAVEALVRCVTLCDEVVGWAREKGHAPLQFTSLANRGSALQLMGRLDEALADLVASDLLAEGAGMRSARANTALYKARLLLARGQHTQAQQVALEGIAIGEVHNNHIGAAALHLLLSEMHESAGEHVSALAHYKRHHGLLDTSRSRAASERSRLLAVQLQTERALADAAANQARADELARTNQALLQATAALGRQAEQDALTGLANRRRLDARLAVLHADAVARAVPLCVAILDVDHFKQVNDQHSHAVGDQVLVCIGNMLSQQCRGDDLAARYGGEEFVLLIAGVGLARAQAVCERVRQAIAAYDWQAVSAGLVVTASFGVCDIATLPTPQAGLAQADALLYRAKRNGRNRVET